MSAEKESGERVSLRNKISAARRAVYSYPQIELSGNASAVFHGNAGICEFEEDHIGVVVNGMLMRLYGDSLEIVSLTETQTVVTGFFRSLTFDS